MSMEEMAEQVGLPPPEEMPIPAEPKKRTRKARKLATVWCWLGGWHLHRDCDRRPSRRGTGGSRQAVRGVVDGVLIVRPS